MCLPKAASKAKTGYNALQTKNTSELLGSIDKKAPRYLVPGVHAQAAYYSSEHNKTKLPTSHRM